MKRRAKSEIKNHVPGRGFFKRGRGIGMRRAVEKLKRDNKKSTFVLQLTAMVDMFTIIIVFLLKSFSTSAVNIEPQKG